MTISYKMACNDCKSKNFRRNILNNQSTISKSWLWIKSKARQTIRQTRPWKDIFLDKNICPVKVSAGSYKCVYIFDNGVVVSVQMLTKVLEYEKIKKKYMKLKELKSTFQKHLNYPGEVFMAKTKDIDYLVSHLPLCYDDLWYVWKKTPEQIPLMKYEDLMFTLIELHKKQIYLCDIKPENIFLCGDNLSFGDLDSSIVYKNDYSLQEQFNYIVATPGYAPIQFDQTWFGKNRNSLEISDFYALSVVICIAYELFYVQPPRYCAAKIYYKINNTNEKNGPLLKITWNDTKFWHVNEAKKFINNYYKVRILYTMELNDLVSEKSRINRMLEQNLKF